MLACNTPVIANPAGAHWALYVLPGDGTVWYADSLLGPGHPSVLEQHGKLRELLMWELGAIGTIECAPQAGVDCGLHLARSLL